MNIIPKDYKEIRSLLDKGQVTCEKLVTQYLENINEQKDLNVFISLFEKESIERAKEIDRKIAAGKAGKLAGAVFTIKDVGDLAILYDLLPGVDVSWILKKYPLLMNQDLDWMFDNAGRSFCVASTHSQKLFLKNELIYVLPPEDLVINFNV